MSPRRRTVTVRAALAALAAALVLPAAPARAQVTRAWRVCFTTHVASCSDLVLTTTPTVGAAGSREGTFVDLLVRHQQGGGVVSGLQDAVLYFTPAGEGSDPGTPFTPEPRLGAPAVPAGAELHWNAGATSTLVPFGINSVGVWNNGWQDQFIGGCLGGAYDATHQSPLATCGAQAYRFAFASLARFDADAVAELSLDVYAGDANGDFFPDQAYCRAPADGTAGAGYDFGDFAAGDVCRVAPLAATAAPEPASLALVGTGLGALAAVLARRRARRAD